MSQFDSGWRDVLTISYLLVALSVVFFFFIVYILAYSTTHGCLTFGECGYGCENAIIINQVGEILYFSGVTFATLGYGDICPEGISFRMISSIEAFVGLTINVSLIALAIKNASGNK